MADAKEKTDSLLSTTTVTAASAAATTLYTVPVGKTLVISKVIVVASADMTTTTLTIGRSTALTDFLNTQTMSALNAAGATGILMPIPNATTVKCVNYAAGIIVQVNITATGGGTTHKFLLYGTLY